MRAAGPIPFWTWGCSANETLRSSIIGGSLFRIGTGALPFLLPLLLQVGFGYTAFEAGLDHLRRGRWRDPHEICRPPILRRLGFRTTLTVNALLCGVIMAAKTLLTALTPHFLISLLLFTGGFFRSLQFTSLNAIAYADVPAEKISPAISLYSVAQQLSSALGVAVAALALEAARNTDGGALDVADIRFAFLVVAALVASSALVHLGLRRDAGETVSGRRRSCRDSHHNWSYRPDLIRDDWPSFLFVTE